MRLTAVLLSKAKEYEENKRKRVQRKRFPWVDTPKRRRKKSQA